VPKDFYRDVAKILLAAGWVRIDGGKGSHEKWQSSATNKIVTVPRSKSRHTANEVLKQAGLPKSF
jgi:predicted RNA binding protein YcfA (HicA-like mRNA interferase family)